MSKVKVLIVEDEMIVAWDLKQAFERLGNEVLPIAVGAEQAVEQTRTWAPDLIPMDITLKGHKTGIDAAMEIRRFSQVPIIYLTGNAHLVDDPGIHATLAQGFYVKPHSEPQLREMLKTARKKRSLE